MKLAHSQFSLKTFRSILVLVIIHLGGPANVALANTSQPLSCSNMLVNSAELSESERNDFARIVNRVFNPFPPNHPGDDRNILSLLRPTFSGSHSSLVAHGRAAETYYFISAVSTGPQTKSSTREVITTWDFKAPSDEIFEVILERFLTTNETWKNTVEPMRSDLKSDIRNRFEPGHFVANHFSSLPPGGESISTSHLKYLLLQLSKKLRDKSYERYMDTAFGISFDAQSISEFGPAKIQHWLVLKTKSTEELSRELGQEITYAGQFYPTRHLAKVGVSYGALKLYADGKPFDYDLPLVDRNYNLDPSKLVLNEGITSFAIKLNLDKVPKGKLKSQQALLMVGSELGFDSAIESTSSLFSKDKNGHYILASMFAHPNNGSRRPYTGKVYSLEEQNLFFAELEQVYQNRSLHLKAARIFREEGIEGVLRRLAPYGYELGKPLSGQVNILNDITNEVARGRIPFEVGDFAKKHGAYSHHVQFLGILQSLSAKSREIFVEMNKRMGDNFQFPFWIVWNILFDATSGKTNDPAYWRDLMEAPH